MDFKTASMPEQRREIVERALSGPKWKAGAM